VHDFIIRQKPTKIHDGDRRFECSAEEKRIQKKTLPSQGVETPSAPAHPKEGEQAVTPSREQLKQCIDKVSIHHLDAIAAELKPTVEILPEQAYRFITQMLLEEENNGAIHLKADLVHFIPICTTMKTATLAKCKVGNLHPFSLDYFLFAGAKKRFLSWKKIMEKRHQRH